MKKNLLNLFILPWFLLGFLSAQAQDDVYEIQLAIYASPEYKKFKSLHSIGYVYSVQQENSLYQIMMGTYSKKSTAQYKLGLVKKKGFKDAYLVKKSLKENEAVYIVQLATYDQQADIYWPDWQRLSPQLVAQLSDSKVRVAAGPYYTRREAEAVQARIQTRGPKDVFIKKVSEKVLHKVGKFDLERSSSYGQNSGAVRNSVRALQELLIQQQLYTAKSNGVLTSSTKSALIKYKKTNERYLRHSRMAEDLAPTSEIEKFTLQYYINMIPNDPATAAAGLKQFKNPISKIYLAYIYLNGDVAIKDKTATVNALMNNALSTVFKGYRGETRYDFSMKYSYEEVGQLIRHLKAMYEVLKERPDMPCWLFERHPKITQEVFVPYWQNRRDDYAVSSDCGSFMEVEEMRVLWLVSKEFADHKTTLKNSNAINKLYVFPQPVAHQEIEELEKWNGRLWKNLKSLNEKSPLQQNMYTLLRFSYYDALQTLETHFMYKGLPGIEARSLGLKILKASIGQNLKAYYAE
ncbi:SPOR domain-containing protein [Aureispira anguillae]|nr:SPOR domain-containing protein [Aureispira anguillae]